MTVAQPPIAAPRRRPRGASSGRLTPASSLGLGVGVLWLSLIVLLPIAAIVVTSAQQGPAAFWRVVTTSDTLAALELSLGAALLVAVVNALVGTVTAWSGW